METEGPRVSLTLTVVPELKLITLIKPVSPAIANNGLPSDSSTLNTQLKKLSFFCHPSARASNVSRLFRVGETLNEPQCPVLDDRNSIRKPSYPPHFTPVLVRARSMHWALPGRRKRGATQTPTIF